MADGDCQDMNKGTNTGRVEALKGQSTAGGTGNEIRPVRLKSPNGDGKEPLPRRVSLWMRYPKEEDPKERSKVGQ
ncbi:hypothetical protein N7497_009125 [Penicillium chrysogenum]|nr:hypothetical protein N7497_009125 [Penicillium chrysogenum]